MTENEIKDAEAKQLSVYMRTEKMIERFGQVTGERHALSYISSVLLLVRNTPALQECTPDSIVTSALRAASLKLSVDPAFKQAYLVPYAKKAVLVVGYKGLYDMAIRTGRYRFINTSEIMPGSAVVFDQFTGAPSIEFVEGAEGGWQGSFQFLDGYGKTIFMTYSDIDAHKVKFAKGWQRAESPWQTNQRKMQEKTVLRRLLQDWGYFDPDDKANLAAIDNDEDIIDAPVIISDPPPDPKPEEISASVSEPVDERNWTDTKLTWLVTAQIAIDLDDAAYILSLSPLPENSLKGDILFWAGKWREQKDLGGNTDEMAANAASVIMNREIIKPRGDEPLATIWTE
jgi:recombination protein RecT